MSDIGSMINDIMPQLGTILREKAGMGLDIVRYFFQWLSENDITAAGVYSQLLRFVMPVLALLILLSVFRRMLRVKNPGEVWGYLYNEELGRFAITHWECIVGRARHCDVRVALATVSKTHCALMRDDRGEWSITNLSGKGTRINGTPAWDGAPLHHGDIIDIGGAEMRFESITRQELDVQAEKRMQMERPVAPWGAFIMLSAFQLLSAVQLCITRPDDRGTILMCYGILFCLMWAYVTITRAAGQIGFEPEILAFFACSLNMAVTAVSTPGTMLKQVITVGLGLMVFVCLGVWMRSLSRIVKTRYFMAGMTVLLFAVNVIFAGVNNGARNWISIFGVSLQPSELAKVCFIFAGAAGLDRLFVRRNLFGFMALSGYCWLALAITSDFGTAAIFFVVFLVIAYLRSGDFATLALICGAAVGGLMLIIRFKPYIASRFSAWGHAWEYASTSGYQQVRTMSAAASGGLVGVGAGNGWLHNVAASNTDLVFGLICEEWGLIIAVLTVMIIFTLSWFAFKVVRAGRSSYYTIAACAATSLLVFQTILNVFGSVDILPLTGVTFPFVSCGGSSMIASWGLLAYVKAADTRQNASFAVGKKAALAEDAPEDALEAIMGRKTREEGEDAGRTIVMKKAGRFRRQTVELERNTERTGPGKDPYEGMIHVDRSSDDEIDAFLAKFDEPIGHGYPEDPMLKSSGRYGKSTGRKADTDTDAFLRSLEEMEPVDDEDWGSRR